MTNYSHIAGKTRVRATTSTPVSAPIPGRESQMVANHAGGYSFTTTEMQRLRRFLVLGVEGNTFYQNKNDLVLENVKVLDGLLKSDPIGVINEAAKVLKNNLALKPNAPLFVLAVAASFKENGVVASEVVRSRALSVASNVIRTPFQLYTFANYINSMRGWGRAATRAIADWYTESPVERLAMHSWKYKNRDGWSHRDLLRLSHPKTDDGERNAIFHYMVKGTLPDDCESAAIEQIAAAEELLHLTGTDATAINRAVSLITNYRLTREAVPTYLLNEKKIWEALVEDMPLTAALRNLGKMTNIGLISTLSSAEAKIVSMLTNKELVERSKAHPMQLLIAYNQYSQGKGDKGSLTWTPSRKVLDGLNDAFELSFGNVPVTNKRIIVAGDDSGSMTWGSVAGVNMSAAKLAAAMMYITIRVEPNVVPICYSTKYTELNVGRRSSLDDMLKAFGCGGGTDTSLPVKYALDKKLDVDAIISYTDNETWAGRGHVTQVHSQLEQKLGHEVKFVNCAVSATNITDVDPNKTSMFEICAFSADTPKVISAIINGDA